ncbi:MAG: M20 family metallo-hydrolase [Desulfovibrionaceae bacterium]|nr:M20 family metallo-hydrolase [Desulfovibrionaceae bacterium]
MTSWISGANPEKMAVLEKLLAYIDGQTDWVEDLQRALTAVPALGPENGGDGEWGKARLLESRLLALGARVLPWKAGENLELRGDPPGLNLRFIEAPDERVSGGSRPNLAARLTGKSRKTLWIIGHMDVVPAGAPDLWETPPFELHRSGDWIRGRGVEDNQQAIASGLLVLETLVRHKVSPDLSYGLLLAADEETHSVYGLDYVLREAPGLIRPEDLVLVPDMGDPEGQGIEISEKSCLWARVTVTGKQGHASRPDQGVNSLAAASAAVLAVDRLHREFPRTDALFSPSCSTFVPTKKEANVENINTLPGRDVFYVDCRILPDLDPRAPLARLEELVREAAGKYGCEALVETVVFDAVSPPPTSMGSEVALRLRRSLQKLRGIRGEAMGASGQTVASFLRARGIPAVCWATLAGNAHQPNEKSSLSFTLADARVFLDMLFDYVPAGG